jgi:hypothetical protein
MPGSPASVRCDQGHSVRPDEGPGVGSHQGPSVRVAGGGGVALSGGWGTVAAQVVCMYLRPIVYSVAVIMRHYCTTVYLFLPLPLQKSLTPVLCCTVHVSIKSYSPNLNPCRSPSRLSCVVLYTTCYIFSCPPNSTPDSRIPPAEVLHASPPAAGGAQPPGRVRAAQPADLKCAQRGGGPCHVSVPLPV